MATTCQKDLVHRLLDRAYGGLGLDRLCEEAAFEIRRLREQREQAARKASLAGAQFGQQPPKAPEPDPSWLFYALGALMAGAVYFLIYVFAYWGR